MQQRRLIMTLFLLQPIVIGSWLPRIPDIQQILALGPAELSIALLGMPLGILIALPIASRLLARMGSRFTIAVGFFLMLLAISLAVWSINQTMLFATLALVGAMSTLLLLALNMEASTIEKLQGSLLLNTCHGFGSVGLMIGSLIGSGLAALSVPITWAVGAVALGTFPLAAATVFALSNQILTTEHCERDKPHRNRIPERRLLGICLFAFGIAMTEGAMADWSAIYLREEYGVGGGAAGIGFTIFAAMVAVGRFTGDYLKAKYGAVPIARICTVLALIGIVTTLSATGIGVAYVGFVLLGYGVSVGYPLAVSAAANFDNQPAASNVATLTFVALLGFLVGPPLIGFIAEYSDLQHGLIVLVPVLVMSLLLAQMLTATATVQRS